MKFLKGLILGGLAGFALGTGLTEQQRRRITANVKKKTDPVVAKMQQNVSQVADTVVDEVNAKLDEAGDAVAERISSTN